MLIKQGAKLVATWEDVWEDLPSQVRLELGAAASSESKDKTAASLLRELVPRPQKSMVPDALHAVRSLRFDELLELLESERTSSEVFTALLDLEIAGRMGQLPGKNYVRAL